MIYDIDIRNIELIISAILEISAYWTDTISHIACQVPQNLIWYLRYISKAADLYNLLYGYYISLFVQIENMDSSQVKFWNVFQMYVV